MKLQLTSDSTGKCAVFVNPERIDERSIYEAALEKLKVASGVRLGESQTGPNADFTPGTIGGNRFTVFLDVDYGADVRADDPDVLDMVQRELEA
mgnify:CR=1 FL=1